MAHAPDEFARTIPYLRRYARALTGSQVLGDQFVGIALQAIHDNPERLASGPGPRREIFRVFHEVWAKAAATRAAGRYDGGPRAWDFVGSTARPERQLLLLVAIEGCSLPEAAYILGIEEDTAQRLFQRARNASAHQPGVPVLIIEDEMMIAMDLESVIESAGHRVCGIASEEAEALDLAVRARPRLILADIHLKGGQSGIAAVRKILCNLRVPVIFITGYPEDLLTGLSPEPAFVITKPFKSETVIAAVSQALLADSPAEPDAAWRLRGRPPEDGAAALHPGIQVAPCAGHPGIPTATTSPLAEGSGHARRADPIRH